MDPNMVINNIISTSADANNVLEAIKDVQQFYQDSFANLLTVMGIVITVGFVLVGVVTPFVMQLLQSHTFKKTERELLEKSKKDIEESKAELKSEIDSQITNVETSLTEKNNELVREIKEEIIVVLGQSIKTEAEVALSMAQKPLNYYKPTLLFLVAAKHLADKQCATTLDITISQAEEASKKLPDKEITKHHIDLNNQLLESCNELFRKIKEKDLDKNFLKRVINIENIIRSKHSEDESEEQKATEPEKKQKT